MSGKHIVIPAVLLTLAASGVEARALDLSSWQRNSLATSFSELRLDSGDKVLVIRGNGQTVEGRVIAVTEEAVSVWTEDGAVTVGEHQIAQIYRFEQRRGRGRGALYGALIGAGIAAGTGLATASASSEDASFGLGFFAVGIASIPSGAVVGMLVSGEKRTLVFENPAVPAPPVALAPRGLSFGVSAGPNHIGRGPYTGAANVSRSGSSRSVVFQGMYRITPRWAFGGELLLTRTGTWSWAYPDGVDVMEGVESREIMAPGFNVHFFPVNGRHEIGLVGGFSVFHQKARQYRRFLVQGRDYTSRFEETKLDYFLKGGVSYHFFVHPRLGVGGEFHVYKGTNFPDPFVRLNVSVAYRLSPH